MRRSLPTTPPGTPAPHCWPTKACAQLTSGGHHVVDVALRAQFGGGFRPFGAMWRQRNELEYPTGPGETTTHDEAQRALRDTEGGAQQLLTTLSIF